MIEGGADDVKDSARIDRLLAAAKGERPPEFSRDWLTRKPNTELTDAEIEGTTTGRLRLRTAGIWATAAMALIGVGFAFYYTYQGEKQGNPGTHFAYVMQQHDAWLKGRRQVRSGMQLPAGARLEISGSVGFVANDTFLYVAKDATAQILKLGKNPPEVAISLTRGTLYARKLPGTGRVSVVTPHARVKVVGTTFSVRSTAKDTYVAVLQGKVQVEVGASTFNLQAGQSLRAGPGQSAVPRAITPAQRARHARVASNTLTNAELRMLTTSLRTQFRSVQHMEQALGVRMENVYLRNGSVIGAVVLQQNRSRVLIRTLRGAQILNRSEVKRIEVRERP